ncbi:MAG: protein kinase [Phycisphaerales bacterium]
MTRAEQIERLFDEGLALPLGERAQWLATLDVDSELRREVASLLEHDAEPATSFLHSPLLRPTDGPGNALSEALFGEHAADGGPAAGLIDAEPLPETIGPYTVIRQIGVGGMGTVYEVEEDRPRRTLAVKLIRPEVATPSMLKRFAREADLLARLDHPGIARVFAAGIAPVEHGGVRRDRAYLAMELVRGQRLDAWASRERPNVSRRLDMVARIADALHHAHQKSVVHRDLKPANVLVSEHGDPRLLDFGVALATDDAARLTTIETGRGGAMIGTLGYMSPEQVTGDPEAVDVRSDVYALGVLAYEMLTGRLPHPTQARSLIETARAIRDDAPERLSRIDRRLSGDVETIVLTAMAKDPARRYQSASEFAADIRRLHRNEPIAARRPTVAYQVRCFAQRNRGLVAGLAAAALALVTATVLSTGFAVRAQADRAEAIDQRERAQEFAAEAQAERLTAIDEREAAEREADRAYAVGEFLERILASADPTEEDAGSPDRTTGEVLDSAGKWIDGAFPGMPEARAATLTMLGRTEKSLSRYERARTHLDKALALLEPDPTLDPLGLATTYIERALVEQSIGTPADTMAFARKGLEVIKQVEAASPGADPNLPGLGFTGLRQAATVWGGYGLLIRRTKWEEDPEPYLLAGLARSRAAGGERDLAFGIQLNNLAGYFVSQGEYTRASEAYEEALDIFREHLAEGHPYFAILTNNLGRLASATGDHDRLIRYSREAIALAEAELGPNNVRISTFYNNLGFGLHESGQFAEADAAFRRSLEITAENEGVASASYASTERNRAWLLMDMKAHAEASEVWGRLAAHYAVELGPDSLAPLVYGALSRTQAVQSDPSTWDAHWPELAVAWESVIDQQGPGETAWERLHLNILAAADAVGPAADAQVTHVRNARPDAKPGAELDTEPDAKSGADPPPPSGD